MGDERMNELQRGIMILLKSAVTGEPGTLPEGFSLEEAMSTIRKHQLPTLAYEGAVLCGIPDTTPQMMHLLQIYCKRILHSEAQMKTVEQLCAAFEEHGIDYMPLKGCRMKALYPKPELRIMGDADILIRMEQYDRIRPIAKGLGLTEQHESDHEYVWQSDALYLELHKRLIPSYNPDYYAYFGDGWRLAKRQRGCRYAMSPEDEFIFQFVHFAKHYRDGGIGCRHVLDLWVYLRSCPQMNMSYIRAELDKLRLLEFYENTRQLLEFWFESGESNDRTEFMTDFIFDSGSWGKWESHVLSTEVRSAKIAGSIRGGKVRSILRAAFPARKDMMAIYPVLKRVPWLLPVIWPVRWVDVVLFRRDNIRKRQQAFRIATVDKVEGYQKALNYVGLDFRLGE